jgi:hypothetical protein
LQLLIYYIIKSDIIGLTDINRIFRLQKYIRFYTLKSAQIQPIKIGGC